MTVKMKCEQCNSLYSAFSPDSGAPLTEAERERVINWAMKTIVNRILLDSIFAGDLLAKFSEGEEEPKFKSVGDGWLKARSLVNAAFESVEEDDEDSEETRS